MDYFYWFIFNIQSMLTQPLISNFFPSSVNCFFYSLKHWKADLNSKNAILLSFYSNELIASISKYSKLLWLALLLLIITDGIIMITGMALSKI